MALSKIQFTYNNMSRYGNYKCRLPYTSDPILRLYGMRYKDSEFKKDFEFYNILENSLGFSTFKTDILMYRFIKKTLWYKFTMWVIDGLNSMTWLGFVNYFVQFLFIRIYASYDAEGKTERKDWKFKGYGILYFVLPLSGWFNNYVVLTKKLNLTKLLYKCK